MDSLKQAKIPLKARRRSEPRYQNPKVLKRNNLKGANGLTGLGIEPVTPPKTQAVFFFSSFSFGQAKEKGRN